MINCYRCNCLPEILDIPMCSGYTKGRLAEEDKFKIVCKKCHKNFKSKTKENLISRWDKYNYLLEKLAKQKGKLKKIEDDINNSSFLYKLLIGNDNEILLKDKYYKVGVELRETMRELKKLEDPLPYTNFRPMGNWVAYALEESKNNRYEWVEPVILYYF